MSTTPLTGRPVADRLGALLTLGLLLQVVGCVVGYLQLVQTDPVDDRDRGVLLAGILAFGLGGVLSLIGVVGIGVLLGLRAHDRS